MYAQLATFGFRSITSLASNLGFRAATSGVAGVTRAATQRSIASVARNLGTKAATDEATTMITGAVGAVVGAGATYLLMKRKNALDVETNGLAGLADEEEDRNVVLSQVATSHWKHATGKFVDAYDAMSAPNFHKALYRFEKKHGRLALNVLLACICVSDTCLRLTGSEPTVSQLEEICAGVVNKLRGTKDASKYFSAHEGPAWDEFRDAIGACLKANIELKKIDLAGQSGPSIEEKSDETAEAAA